MHNKTPLESAPDGIFLATARRTIGAVAGLACAHVVLRITHRVWFSLPAFLHGQ
jgi:hypothetical protein